MEQPSPTNNSKHLQEDTERAISRAAAEQEERSPEALLNAVCAISDTHTHTTTLTPEHHYHSSISLLEFLFSPFNSIHCLLFLLQ